MGITAVVFVIVVLVAFLLFKRLNQISSKAARAHLLKGALVVDVRTNAEFQAHHLPNALHIPFQELETLIARRVRDKNQILLLHCQSGMRSQNARRKLMDLGYTQAFNLGSYSRAERIVGHR
jgi:phage shock protein E